MNYLFEVIKREDKLKYAESGKDKKCQDCRTFFLRAFLLLVIKVKFYEMA